MGKNIESVTDNLHAPQQKRFMDGRQKER